MAKQTVTLGAIVIAVATLAHGQQTGPVAFARGTVAVRGGGAPGTAFTGRADRHELVGGLPTYRGNVSIVFADSHLLVQADELTWAEDSNELSISGNVRLRLDAQGLPF